MNLIRNAFAASAVLLAVASFVFTNVSINITTSETPFLPLSGCLLADLVCSVCSTEKRKNQNPLGCDREALGAN